MGLKLPAGCVSVRLKPTSAIYVIEMSERMQDVTYRDLYGKVFAYRLSWPRTLWFVKFRALDYPVIHAVRIEIPYSVARRETPLAYFPMPNVDVLSGGMCAGCWEDHSDSIFPYDADEVMQWVLMSVWNEEIPAQYGLVGLRDMRDWAMRSDRDSFAYKLINVVPLALPRMRGVPNTVDGLLTILSRGT